jgi:molecular chaperone DnaJ
MNLYFLLGVSKDSEQATIKSAYKKLALKWHPDKNNGSEEATETFKSISEAYAILSNPQRRKRYDLYGETSAESDMFEGDDWMFGADDAAFEEFINILEKDDFGSF